MTRRIVVISDSQLPYEDRKATASLIDFIGTYQPDEVVHIGDLMDYPQPSRWNKGTALEFEGSVFQDSEYAKLKFLEPLRSVYDGPVGVLEGNHDERPRVYHAKYSPALAESDAFDLPTLLDFEGYGINLLPDFYKFAPGWVMIHGHKPKLSLSQTAGVTALNAGIKMGTSVIMGHTHRLGAVSKTVGFGGEGSTTTGVEVGNLMDMKLAGYLKGGTANWQQGFAVVTVDGEHVKAEPIPISGKKFVVDGKVYKVS